MRSRLGAASGEAQDIWWHARDDEAVIADVGGRLERYGLPFLERFATRDKILSEWQGLSRNVGAGGPPRIVMAIILAQRGEKEGARRLLAQQVRETHNRGHPEYVRKLAKELSVGNVDG